MTCVFGCLDDTSMNKGRLEIFYSWDSIVMLGFCSYDYRVYPCLHDHAKKNVFQIPCTLAKPLAHKKIYLFDVHASSVVNILF